LLLLQGGAMRSLLFVCLSITICLSVCEQDNSRTRLWMSTKHGRHGQGVTL